jgi:hypothetical protein
MIHTDVWYWYHTRSRYYGTYCWGSTVWYVVPAAAEVPAAGMIPAVLVNNMYVIMNITGAISNRN